MVDNITDIKVDDNLDITIDDTNDITTTRYEDTPLQSVFIHVKNTINRYIGRRITDEVLNSLSDEISREINNKDPQIDEVAEISVSYDGTSNEVTATVTLIFNEQFETVEITGEI